MLWICCSWKYDSTLLNMPAENYLHIGLAVFLSQFSEYSFRECLHKAKSVVKVSVN